MERKVLRQGPTSLVVSLPSKWVKRNSIKKGQGIQVKEKGQLLEISTKPKPQKKAISLNVANTLPMTHRIVGAIYRAGYDEMTFEYAKSEEAKAIIQTAKVMTGHEIFSHTNKKIIIKKISEDNIESLEKVFRKCFHVLKDMANDTVLAIKEENKELYEEVILKDDIMSVFVDYVRRLILIKQDATSATEYHVAVQIEKIADRYKYLCRHYLNKYKKDSKEKQNKKRSKTKKRVKQKIAKEKREEQKEIIKLLQNLNEMIKLSEELFYNASLPKITLLGKKRKSIQQEIKKNIESKKEQLSESLHHCASILELVFDLNGVLIIKHVSKKFATC